MRILTRRRSRIILDRFSVVDILNHDRVRLVVQGGSSAVRFIILDAFKMATERTIVSRHIRGTGIIVFNFMKLASGKQLTAPGAGKEVDLQ
jgi:hypothetical protein